MNPTIQEHIRLSPKRAKMVRVACMIFAPALLYLAALQFWAIHNQPGQISGTRIYHLGIYGDIGLFAELALLVSSIVATFCEWRKGVVLVTLALMYFLIPTIFYGPWP